jgi:nickel/cobalt exporter
LGTLATLGVLAGTAVAAAPATPAAAHPSGPPFSVNQYAGLAFTPDGVRVVAVLHTEEIVTRQDRRTVDADRDGTLTGAERSRYAHRACADLAAHFEVQVNGERLAWTVVPGDYRDEPGAAGLPSARLTCDLSAPARLSAAAAVTVANHHLLDHAGWRELTAVGHGVRLVDSRLPEHSVSDELRAIPPADALVLDVRSATLRVEPGPGTPGTPATPTPPAPTANAERPGLLAAGTTWAQRRLETLAGGPLTPLLAILAVLVALLLGAGHAALPGHGKTVLAVYLASRRGRVWDAVAVGSTVTFSHTGAVLVVGLLISTATAVVGDRLLGYLAMISGLLIVAVGIGMLVAALRRRARPRHDDSHDHGHGHSHDHSHGYGHDHHHTHHHDRPAGRLGLVGIGLAGGLVPSPSALVVLLASIGMGRAVFGVLLVLAYGLGMAGTLTAAGLLLLAVQRRVTHAQGSPARLLARLYTAAPAAWPLITSTMVLAVGVGLTLRAAVTFA